MGLDQEDAVEFMKAKASSELQDRVKSRHEDAGTGECGVNPLYPDCRFDDVICQSSGFAGHGRQAAPVRSRCDDDLVRRPEILKKVKP